MSLAACRWRRWQQLLLASVARDPPAGLVAIRGGLGSGKSAALIYTAALLAIGRPGAQIAVVTDTWPRLRDVLLPLCAEILGGLGGAYSVSDRTWTMPGGSRIHLRAFWVASTQTVSQNPLEGLNLHAALVDECQTLDERVLKVASSRARIQVLGSDGAIHPPLVVLCGVPVDPCWWVSEVSSAGGMLYLPTSRENAEALSPEWFERQRSILLPDEYDGLINNRPRPPRGRVLDTWGPECLLPPGWSPPPGAEVVVTADLGRRMPAALCLTRDERIAAWVIHAEYMPDEMLTGEFGAGIKAQGWRADRLICDPAGSAANAQTGRSDLDVLEETTGLYPERTTDPAKRDIRAGIIRLRRALAAGQIRVTAELWAAGMSAPKRQRTLARCILGYAYPAKGGDEPLKDGRFDHAIDALRYFAIRELWYDHPLDGRGYKAQV